MTLPDQNRDQGGPAAPTCTRLGSGGVVATYLLTWACYGAWLPGQPGAIRRTRNQYNSPLPEPDFRNECYFRNRMTQAPYLLDDAVRRHLVLQSLQALCAHRTWTLWACHVRTNHVHAVTAANTKPEQVITAMKAYASHSLNQNALEMPDRRRWARHGSTCYLWTDEAVQTAIQYVLHQQGEPMAVFERPLSPPGLRI